MKEFFKELFEYGHYYNQQIAGVILMNPDKTSEKSIKLFSHVLNAHQIWNNRIEARQNSFGVWEIHSMQVCSDIDKLNYEHSLYILDNFDLDKSVTYANTKGQTFTNSTRDILFHTINHSTYHRGQIATEFRQSGLEPVATDFILYKRSLLKANNLQV